MTKREVAEVRPTKGERTPPDGAGGATSGVGQGARGQGRVGSRSQDAATPTWRPPTQGTHTTRTRGEKERKLG